MTHCFEYHRDSELNIAADDAILLVAHLQDVTDGQIDSSKTEAFLLPKGTNEEMPNLTPLNEEDKWLRAANKWLLAHKDTAEAKDGAHIGITGANIDIADSI